MTELIFIKTPQAVGSIVNWMVGAMIFSVIFIVLAQLIANPLRRLWAYINRQIG